MTGNNESEMLRKERAVAYFKVLYQHLAGRAEKNTITIRLTDVLA
jgi:hypothetical protein